MLAVAEGRAMTASLRTLRSLSDEDETVMQD